MYTPWCDPLHRPRRYLYPNLHFDENVFSHRSQRNVQWTSGGLLITMLEFKDVVAHTYPYISERLGNHSR